MSKLGIGLGKEVWQGILIALACIVVFVSIGSTVAQLKAAGEEHEAAEATSNEAEAGTPAGAAEAEPSEAAKPENPSKGEPANQ